MIPDIFIPFWCETEEKAALSFLTGRTADPALEPAKETEISGTAFESNAEE
ncbi:hypothetical protein [Bradyrhizobium sp. USDA 4454]